MLGDTEKGQPFGPYVLLQKIATGGMAEVWRARQSGVEGFQKEVAIKRILPHLTDNEAFVSMFVDEAKLAAQLSHPNIIHIYDLGKIGSDYYIAMEYVEGHNLREILSAARRRNMKVPLGLALLVASRLASALDYAHRKKGFDGRELGLVHRDVSPQNVLISSEGEIKLCDFGIVKAVSKASHTQMGALKGKLQYMSPEQAWGRPLDGRSDIFALGAILFEIMTGRRLFAGDNEVAILDAVREGRIQSPRDLEPSVPENVERLVLKALEKNPEQRFSSAGTLQMAAENVLYALKPTPTQADLATWLRRLFGNEPLEAEEESSFADLAHLADLPGEKELAAPLLADEALPLPRPPAPAMDS
ncbi:MAG TPA: serine/threonine-protein kinase, partial [Thermoanaerobaculia bacterium]|nr:serine/threonine-protein kinase [Thermoanaerobaculia bacterium]